MTERVNATSESERAQKEQFDRLAMDYEAHYGDEYAEQYRARFYNEPMLGDLSLAGKDVLEAMCGTGQTAQWLLDRGARLTGLDISSVMIERYRERFPAAKAVCASALATGLPSESFDVVVIVGGLHHLHPHVDGTMDEMHRILRVGGHLAFVEPHAGAWIDVARKAWYARDTKHFAENEASVDLETLFRAHARQFEVERLRYLGSFGYLTTMNSLILRVPQAWKRFYCPAAIAMDSVFNARNQSPRLAFYAAGRLRKLAA